MDLNNISQLIGELKGELASHKEWERVEHCSIHEAVEKLSVELKLIREELSIYKTIYKTVKFVIGAVILVITFKLGDIKHLFYSVFK